MKTQEMTTQEKISTYEIQPWAEFFKSETKPEDAWFEVKFSEYFGGFRFVQCVQHNGQIFTCTYSWGKYCDSIKAEKLALIKKEKIAKFMELAIFEKETLASETLRNGTTRLYNRVKVKGGEWLTVIFSSSYSFTNKSRMISSGGENFQDGWRSDFTGDSITKITSTDFRFIFKSEMIELEKALSLLMS